MIASLSGTLAEKNMDFIVVDVGGVGYQVYVSLNTHHRLPEEGESLSLLIHTYVREDAFTLFGFIAREERELFLLLMSVTKVGAKMAKTILSGIQPKELCFAIRTSDSSTLQKISGVGAKLAQRLILELKDKIQKVSVYYGDAPEAIVTPAKKTPNSSVVSELSLALESLGYQPKAVSLAIRKLKAELGGLSLEDSIRLVLKELSS